MGEGVEGPGRVGWYVDSVYKWADDERGGQRLLTVPAAFPFLLFACEVGKGFDGLHLFGRTTERTDAGTDIALPDGPDLIPLPYYESLASVGTVIRGAIGTIRAMWSGLDHMDRVVVSGPHPRMVLALLAFVRRGGVVLGIRQDTMPYLRSRVRRRSPALLVPAWLIDRSYHGLSRVLPCAVVDDHLERSFGGPRPASSNSGGPTGCRERTYCLVGNNPSCPRMVGSRC